MIRSKDFRPRQSGTNWAIPSIASLLWAVGAVAVGIALGAGANLLTDQPAVGVLALLGGAAAVIILTKPEWGFVLLAVGAGFVTSLELPIGNIGPGEMVVLILLPLTIMGLATQTYRFQPLAIYWPMGLYLALGLLSITYVQHLGSAIPKIVQWLNFGAVLVVTTVMRPSRPIIKAAIGALLLVEAILGCIAIGTTLSRGLSEAGLYILDFHKNALGLYMALALPILLARFLWPLNAATRRNTILLLLPVAAGLILSGSRGAWVATLVAIVVLVAYRSWKTSLTVLLLLPLFLYIGGWLLPESFTRTSEIINGTGTVGGRYIYWLDAWHIYLAHPLTGVGIGNYLSISNYIGPLGNYNTTDPHNVILRVLAELGPLGLACFLAIWALIGKQALQNNRVLTSPDLQALNAGLSAAIVCYIVSSMFEPGFLRGHGTLFFFFAGLLYVLPHLEKKTERAAADIELEQKTDWLAANVQAIGPEMR